MEQKRIRVRAIILHAEKIISMYREREGRIPIKYLSFTCYFNKSPYTLIISYFIVIWTQKKKEILI